MMMAFIISKNNRLHFDGVNHRNKVMLVYERSQTQELIWYDVDNLSEIFLFELHFT